MLSPVIEDDGVRIRYLLSEEYSGVDGLEALAALLRDQPFFFFEAMSALAGHLLFNAAQACRLDGKRLLIIEDGGYIAPIINRLCLEKRSLGEAVEFFGYSRGQFWERRADQPTARLAANDPGRQRGAYPQWI